MTALDPHTDMILAAIVDGRTNLSGAWIADGIAAYRRPRDVAVQSVQPPIDDTTPAQSLRGQIDAGNGHSAPQSDVEQMQTDNGRGAKTPANKRRSFANDKRGFSRPAKRKERTPSATQMVIEYLSAHADDLELSADTLLLKLVNKRMSVGRSSVAKALRIMRTNG